MTLFSNSYSLKTVRTIVIKNDPGYIIYNNETTINDLKARFEELLDICTNKQPTVNPK